MHQKRWDSNNHNGHETVNCGCHDSPYSFDKNFLCYVEIETFTAWEKVTEPQDGEQKTQVALAIKSYMILKKIFKNLLVCTKQKPEKFVAPNSKDLIAFLLRSLCVKSCCTQSWAWNVDLYGSGRFMDWVCLVAVAQKTSLPNNRKLL